MSTLFENINEATCGLDSGSAFTLVTTDDVGVTFTDNTFSLTTTNVISTSKLVFNQATFSGTNVDFKVKYITKVGDPAYHKLSFVNICTS
jgi:hypothetical protein